MINTPQLIKTRATFLQQFLILFLGIAILTCGQVNAQSCAQYFGYYSLSAKELRSLQELAQLEIEVREIQEISKRSPKLLEVERRKQEYVNHGISTAVYEKILREVYDVLLAESSVESARNYEEQRQSFLMYQGELALLKKYRAETVTEALYKAREALYKPGEYYDINDIKKIFETTYIFEKLDLTYEHERYGSILHIAAEYGTPEILKKIILLGVDVNKIIRIENTTPLDLAYVNKDNFFTLLELNGHSHNINDLLGRALGGPKTSYEVIEYLMDNTTDVNYRSSGSNSSLLRWIRVIEARADSLKSKDISERDTLVLRALLEKGADPTVQNFWGDTPLRTSERPTTKAILKEAIVKWKAEHGGTTP